MNSKFENGTLTVFFEGRIDSSNADAKGAELKEIIEAGSFENLVIDMSGLEYISSAGLRVILRTRQANPSLKLIEVSSEVYEVLEMTGFTEMIPVEKAYRQFSVDGCKVIGEGAKGTVYRYNGDTVVKVYKSVDSLPDIQKERELARKAFVLGIPTAISYDVVKVGDKFGSVFELLDAKSYSQLIAEDPANQDKYIKEYALLLKQIHETIVKKDDMPDFKDQAGRWMEKAKKTLKPETAEKVEALIAALPDTLNMLHCDYHTNNVMSQNGEALLIDMDTLSHGHPVFELGNVYITYAGFSEFDPSNVEGFLGISHETAMHVWEVFLPAYLGTDDPARLKEVENKAKLLSYVRLMNHYTKRGALDTEEGRKILNSAAESIEQLLTVIDTLEF